MFRRSPARDRRFVFLIVRVALASAILASGCSIFRPLIRPFIKPFVVDRIDPGFEVPDGATMVFYVDGLRKDVLEEMAAAGEIPRLKRLVLDRAASVQHAVSSVPSTTYANATSMVSGLFPPHHGVVANKWFDRDRLVFRSYESRSSMKKVNTDVQSPTVFEMLDDKLTAVIGMQMNRGTKLRYVTDSGDGGLPAGVAWSLGYQDEVDTIMAQHIAELAEEVRCLRRWPDLTFVYFPGPDDVAHFKGPNSCEYRASIRSLDASLGSMLCALDRGGVLDRMNLVLTADHGMHAVEKCQFLDVAAHLATLGIPAYHGEGDVDEDVGFMETSNDSTLPSRVRRFRSWPAVVSHSGDRQAFVHLRVGTEWTQRPTLEQTSSFQPDREVGMAPTQPELQLPARLVEHPAIAFVAVRDGIDAVQLWGNTGVARIERDRGVERAATESSYRYTVVSGDDPIFHEDGGAPAIADGNFHPSREWLEATAALSHPDAVAQLGNLFDHRRTGDVALFADHGWDFSRKYLGGHGGLEHDEMQIPFYFVGPKIAAGKQIHAARLVDLVPTVLELVGHRDRIAAYRLDGRSLVPELESAAPESMPSK